MRSGGVRGGEVMAKTIDWKFTHVMKDGRVLKPGERLPITPEGIKVFSRAVEILRDAAKRMEKSEESKTATG